MRARKIVASVVLIYNLIGLVTILGLYPSDPFYWDGSILMLLFTLPITIISFGLRYFSSDILLPVIVQIATLALTLFIADCVVKKIVKKRE